MSLPLDILLAIDLPCSAQHHKWFLSMWNLIFGSHNGKSASWLRHSFPGEDLSCTSLAKQDLWSLEASKHRLGCSCCFFFFSCLKLSGSTEQHWFHVSFCPATTFFAITILGQKSHICLIWNDRCFEWEHKEWLSSIRCHENRFRSSPGLKATCPLPEILLVSVGISKAVCSSYKHCSDQLRSGTCLKIKFSSKK